MKNPERLEDAIDNFCQKWARSNRRPDMGDVTVRKMFARELAREIRKVARVTRRRDDARKK